MKAPPPAFRATIAANFGAIQRPLVVITTPEKSENRKSEVLGRKSAVRPLIEQLAGSNLPQMDCGHKNQSGTNVTAAVPAEL